MLAIQDRIASHVQRGVYQFALNEGWCERSECTACTSIAPRPVLVVRSLCLQSSLVHDLDVGFRRGGLRCAAVVYLAYLRPWAS